MRCIFGIVILLSTLAIPGCQNVTSTRLDDNAPKSVSYVSTDELSAAVDENGIVLVEFCVPSGCARCNQMRQQIDQLASDENNQITIRRVNLNQQPGLAWELGVKVCPSYVAFRDGEEIFRAAYPTSADLIASGLVSALEDFTPDQLAQNDL